jgi:seryl-tRNA synthetase
VGAVVLLIAVSVNSQQRVQSTTQLTIGTPVVADPLTEWEQQYAEAMKVATELAILGNHAHAKRLVDDLEDLDEALREYVRASERLRHKDRALSETMQFLTLQNSMQMESRQYQTISNALKAAHDAESATVRNLK